MSTAFGLLSLSLTSLSLLVPYAVGLIIPEPRNLIVGGVEAPEGRYSYAVSLKDVRTGSHYCGGSLISKSIILTAAHCVALDESFTVVIGRHNLTDDTVGDEVTISEKVLHPIYNMMASVDYDIALVFLSRPTTADVDIVHINADKSVPLVGTDVTYLGWGEIDSDGSTVNASAILREVESDVITNDQCDAVKGIVDGTKNIESYRGLISEAMICTFAIGKDSCQKDSGGPLIMQGNDASTDVQVGVASWGISCASNVFPGVSARISSVYNWLEDTVCDKSIDPGPSFECANNTVLVIEIPELPEMSETPELPEISETPDHNTTFWVIEIPEMPETLGKPDPTISSFATNSQTTTTAFSILILALAIQLMVTL